MSKIKLPDNADWTFDSLYQYDEAIGAAAQHFGLDTFPIQLEMISSEQMLDAYASTGMPVNYYHWSFGKHFLDNEKKYKRGQMGLAYEIVINSNPCVAYLLDANSLPLQAIIIAHACYGHNSFFKNNYLFKRWTEPEAIVDYLIFAKNFISKCEQQHGIDAVENILDAAHALKQYGIDKYQQEKRLSLTKEKERQLVREQHLASQVNELWKKVPNSSEIKDDLNGSHPNMPEVNVLYFLEKNSPTLQDWEREILRIVRKMAQYFYPQKQTKIMNEGWATFWHYTIINYLFDQGQVSDKFMIDFMKNHTNVIFQPDYDDPYYAGLNPYTLGYNIFIDIKRICEDPTEEDRHYFPDLVDTDWINSVHFAMEQFKDESFILQYLSPHVIRKMKLFSVVDDDRNDNIIVSAIHNESGYQAIRQNVSKQFNVNYNEPNIEITHVDFKDKRTLTLTHHQEDNRPLESVAAAKVMKHLHELWGYPIVLQSIDENQNILQSFKFPEDPPIEIKTSDDL